MLPIDPHKLETDPRFPSGPWTGFFMQHLLTGRQTMTLDLTFRDGQLDARGTDIVGPFTFSGTYDRQEGKCRWVKQYLGKHKITYAGVNEGRGIWGVWEINVLWGLIRDRGVFHIWPEGMTPPDETELTERAFLADSGKGRVITGVVGAVLLVGVYLFFRFFGFQWLEKILR
jgi:hypothetical protein